MTEKPLSPAGNVTTIARSSRPYRSHNISVARPGFRRILLGGQQEIVKYVNKNLKYNEKSPNKPRNIAGVFVWQLAVLTYSPCATNCLFVLFSFT
jgi:hypothetical protein